MAARISGMTQTYGHGGQHPLLAPPVPQFEAPTAPQYVPAEQVASDAQPPTPKELHAGLAGSRQTRPPTPQCVTQTPHVPQEEPSVEHGGSVVVVVLRVAVAVGAAQGGKH